MAMSSGGSEGGPMSEINVTPLVDVMLVLLIIFMITAPLLSHKIKVKVPEANPHITKETTAKPIDLAIKSDGTMFWNDQEINQAELEGQLRVAASNSPQPELQIRADKTLQYKDIKRILQTAKDSGMVHIGFITTGKE